jgi:hypothetical protein
MGVTDSPSYVCTLTSRGFPIPKAVSQVIERPSPGALFPSSSRPGGDAVIFGIPVRSSPYLVVGRYSAVASSGSLRWRSEL